MMKIDWKPVGDYAGQLCKVILYGVAVVAYFKASDYIIRPSGNMTRIEYSDAVRVIMESNMFDSKKTEAISVLRHDGDDNYYKAVIHVVKSNMFDSKKIETIIQLSL